MEVLPSGLRENAIQLCTLLRLSVLLHRNRSRSAGPAMQASADNNSIRLHFPNGWLKNHPLTLADLDLEKKHLKSAGLKLEYN
jgi:exopolyphosphatase/guanosine-5'-triphosphate,3'-diphosphate pyrophosphatase